MSNIVIIFVLSTNAVCCILLDKNKNIYATFLIIFVGEAVFMFQKIILELTNINWQPNWPELSLQQIPSPLEEVDSSGSCLSCFLILYILSIWNKNISFSSLFPAKAQPKCSKLKRQSSFIWKPSILSSLPRAPPSQSRSFLLTPNSFIPTRHATSSAKRLPSH